MKTELIKQALHWVEQNKGMKCAGCNGCYSSPRVSSELPDCSLPMTFDQYNYCSLGCLYCVSQKTRILISFDGYTKNIERLTVGDTVISKDVKTGKIERDSITSVMERNVDTIYDLTLENGKTLHITGEHPVYVVRKGWIPVNSLKEGDDLDFRKSWRSAHLVTNNPMKNPKIRHKTLRKIVATWIRNGRSSKGEQQVRASLSRLGYNFVQQAIVPGPKRNYILDFLLPDQHCCVEYDGHSRHYTEKGKRDDKGRDKWILCKYKIRTVRIHRDMAFIKPKILDIRIRNLIMRNV